MEPIARDRNNKLSLILVPLVSVSIFVILYLLRELDDNRLTSWRWAFEHVSFLPVFIAICLVSALAVWASRFNLPSSRIFAGIAFITGAAFWQVPEVMVDASRYFTQAKHLSEYGILYYLRQWGAEIVPWTDMPLIPMIYGFGFSVFGESRLVVQLITTSAFAGSVWLTAESARELFNKADEQAIAPIASVFLLSIPFLYTHVPLMMVDVPCMFFLVLGFFALQRALVRGGWPDIAFASVAIFLMLISKYSQWMLASVYVLLFFYYIKGKPVFMIKTLIIKRGIGVFLGTGLLFSIFIIAYYDVVQAQMELLISYQRPGLRRWGESFLSTLFYQINPFVTLCAIGSAFVAFKRRDARWLVVAWLLILVFVLWITRSRYILPILPMLAITSAYGLNALAIDKDRIKRLVALTAMLGSIVIASGAFMPYLKTNNLVNLMVAGKFLNQQEVTLVQAHAFPQKSTINPSVAVPLLDLYTSAPIEYLYHIRPLYDKETIDRLPFRFTWTYRNPAYYDYAIESEKPSHYAVISFWDDKTNAGRLPDGAKLLKRFDISEGRFRFKPYVSVFEMP